jgi:hypothetical protein
MGAISPTFDYDIWVKRYPEFSNVDSDLAYLYWQEAGLYLNNDGGSPVATVERQDLLLGMLTAHIAQLNKHNEDGSTVSDLVGRISSGNEGSVSVDADMDYPPGSPQWYIQTKYGAAFWQATAVYRTFRYKRKIPRIFNPVFGGRPWW